MVLVIWLICEFINQYYNNDDFMYKTTNTISKFLLTFDNIKRSLTGIQLLMIESSIYVQTIIYVSILLYFGNVFLIITATWTLYFNIVLKKIKYFQSVMTDIKLLEVIYPQKNYYYYIYFFLLRVHHNHSPVEAVMLMTCMSLTIFYWCRL